MTPDSPIMPSDLDGYIAHPLELARTAAFLVRIPEASAAAGSTHQGAADLPADAPWAQRRLDRLADSPQDGEAFCFQLNFEEVPVSVRKPHWPSQGIVWVFAEASAERYGGSIEFDPRPVAEIPWAARDRPAARAYRWTESASLPACTPQVLPQIAWSADLQETFDNWAIDFNARHAHSDWQVGGWMWPCQGQFDRYNETIVAQLSRQPFGDSGEVSLHYAPARGFFVCVETH